MTRRTSGEISMNPSYYGRRAVIVGKDLSAKSQRINHAQIKSWVE